jgi:hypothetical protein
LTALVLATDPNGIAAVRSALAATGAFYQVDAFEAWNTAVSALDLAPYDAVLAYTYVSWKAPADGIQIGDMLADFHDAGGRVVVANGANCDGFALAGRFVSDGYLRISLGNINPNGDDATVALEPSSPLLVGVPAFTPFAHCDGAPVAGATVVLGYASTGDPVAVRGLVGGRKRVDLNYMPSGTLGIELIANALRYQ